MILITAYFKFFSKRCQARAGRFGVLLKLNKSKEGRVVY